MVISGKSLISLADLMGLPLPLQPPPHTHLNRQWSKINQLFVVFKHFVNIKSQIPHVSLWMAPVRGNPGSMPVNGFLRVQLDDATPSLPE